MVWVCNMQELGEQVFMGADERLSRRTVGSCPRSSTDEAKSAQRSRRFRCHCDVLSLSGLATHIPTNPTRGNRTIMTKKDFELIARVIAQTVVHGEVIRGYARIMPEVLASNMADALASTNTAFDRARFLAACEGRTKRQHGVYIRPDERITKTEALRVTEFDRTGRDRKFAEAR